MLADQDNPLDSDPASRKAAPGEPHVVVIYRGRGIPWMVIPPLLLFVAVLAVIGYRRYEPMEFPRLSTSAAPGSSVATTVDTVQHSAEGSQLVATVYQVPGQKTAAPVVALKSGPYPGPDLSVRPSIPGEPAPVTDEAEVGAPTDDPVAPAAEPAGPVTPSPKLESPSASAPKSELPKPGSLAPSEAALAPAPKPAPTLPRIESTPASAPMLEAPNTGVAVLTPIGGEVPAPPPVKRDAIGFDPDAAKVVANELATQGKPKNGLRDNANDGAYVPPNRDSTPSAAQAGIGEPNEEMLEQQQREAERRLAVRAGIDSDGPDLLNPDPRDIQKRRAQFVMASRKVAAEDRAPFHEDLRKIIAEQGSRSGAAIQQLCNRYGRDTTPEIHVKMNRDLTGPAARLSTGGRIERMRYWGVPETIILDDLVDSYKNDVKGRNGPRTPTESWVFAARVLLAHPPTKPGAAKPATAPDPTR